MSIAAMTWAFGLPLSPSAKVVLLAIADHADERAACWPSLSLLAERATQSKATVQRRIKEMEQAGLLVRFPRFRPDGGRSADEIRLNLKMSAADIAAHHDDTAHDEEGPEVADSGEADAVPPVSNCNGGDRTRDTAPVALVRGGPVALVQPPYEPSLRTEESPKPPLPAEPEHFDAFMTNCLGWRVMDRTKALQVFVALDPDEQLHARAASPLHAAECLAHKRRSKDAHKLLTERFWERYPNAKLAEKPPEPVWISDPAELAALRVMRQIADFSPPRLSVRDGCQGLERMMPVSVDLLALSAFDGIDELDWLVAEEGSAAFYAWAERLHHWTGRRIDPRIVKRRGSQKIQLLGEWRDAPNRARGLPVPCQWPPRKDGSIGGERAPSAAPEFTEDDAEALAQEGRSS